MHGDPWADDGLVRFWCGECNKRYKASAAHAGQRIVCGKCGAVITIPLADIDQKTEMIEPGDLPIPALANLAGPPPIPRAASPFIPATPPPPPVSRHKPIAPVDPVRSAITVGLVLGVAGLVFGAAGGAFLSQFFPMFGGFLATIGQPFSPARLYTLIPHVIVCGGMAGMGGFILGAAIGYLSNSK